MTDQDGWGEPQHLQRAQGEPDPLPRPQHQPYAAPTWQPDEAQTQVFRSSRHLAKSRRKPRRTRIILLAIVGSVLVLAAIAAVLSVVL
jgi:hypothetical protein